MNFVCVCFILGCHCTLYHFGKDHGQEGIRQTNHQQSWGCFKYQGPMMAGSLQWNPGNSSNETKEKFRESKSTNILDTSFVGDFFSATVVTHIPGHLIFFWMKDGRSQETLLVQTDIFSVKGTLCGSSVGSSLPEIIQCCQQQLCHSRCLRTPALKNHGTLLKAQQRIKSDTKREEVNCW